MYKTIFFDLDGTLIDPKIGITKAVQHALNKFGIQEENPNNLLEFIGPPLHLSFQHQYGFDEKKSLLAIKYFLEYFLPKGIYENFVYPDIPPLLQKLQTANKRISIVTHKPTKQAEHIIAYHNLESFFEKIIGPKADLSNDKALLIHEALQSLPEEERTSCVMIGDREHDIIGANANGIDSIAVTYGYGEIEKLKDAKPTYIVHSVADLEKYL